MHQITNFKGELDVPVNLEKYILSVCAKHHKEERALAFAFIIYDFDNPQVSKILKDPDYFNALDFISSDILTVFYLNSEYVSSQSKSAAKSNVMRIELAMEKVDAPPNLSPKFLAENLLNEKSLPSPSILFFQVSGFVITEYTIANLRENEIEKGFIEMKDIINNAVTSIKQVEHPFKDNHKEIFNLIRGAIESSEFWKTAKTRYDKFMKIKDFLLFWKI
jgi:hypothetical protein